MTSYSDEQLKNMSNEEASSLSQDQRERREYLKSMLPTPPPLIIRERPPIKR